MRKEKEMFADVTPLFECGFCELCWVCIAWKEMDYASVNRYFMKSRGLNLKEAIEFVENGKEKEVA